MVVDKLRVEYNELKARIDLVEGVEDSVLIVLASITGAGMTEVYSKSSDSVEMAAFVLPIFIILVLGLTLMKAWIRSQDREM